MEDISVLDDYLQTFVSVHIFFRRPSMSQGTVMYHNRLQEKDFTVATPEEFVKRFQGTKVINKVSVISFLNIIQSECSFLFPSFA